MFRHKLRGASVRRDANVHARAHNSDAKPRPVSSSLLLFYSKVHGIFSLITSRTVNIRGVPLNIR